MISIESFKLARKENDKSNKKSTNTSEICSTTNYTTDISQWCILSAMAVCMHWCSYRQVEHKHVNIYLECHIYLKFYALDEVSGYGSFALVSIVFTASIWFYISFNVFFFLSFLFIQHNRKQRSYSMDLNRTVTLANSAKLCFWSIRKRNVNKRAWR